MQRKALERTIEVACHVLTWSYIFLSPLLFKRTYETVDWQRYLHISFLPFCTCVVFYINP